MSQMFPNQTPAAAPPVAPENEVSTPAAPRPEAPPTPHGEKTVHLVSLGCPKNRVDSEVMLGLLERERYRVVETASDAEVIIVNTCAFIGPAKEESVSTVLDMAQHRIEGRCREFIVTGCLVQRYPGELQKELPEVDHFLGTGDFQRLGEILHARSEGSPVAATAPRALVRDPEYLYDAQTPRIRSTAKYTAYVKISEGCDNQCTFCIIPKLRGAQRSRPIDDVVAEVTALARDGVREVNLVAQDLTAYGYDLPGRPKLVDLLRGLAKVEDLRWIRLHYAYPRVFSDELIELIATEPKICKYIDMPLQHASDPILRSMKRGRDAAWLRKLLAKLRERIPGLVLRTTFIVGFPGETDADFELLADFVREQEFDRVGVFRFSREEGTPSFDLPDQVPAKVAAKRHARLVAIQRRIALARNRAQVGRRLEVLVEGPSEETEHLLVGRDAGRAPEVDGLVYLNDGEARAGDFVEVEITQAADYDLVGRIVGPAAPRTAAGVATVTAAA